MMLLLKAMLTGGTILLLVGGWLWVTKITTNYALRHPEFGPPREEGGGCGGSCSCKSGGSCKNG